MYVAGGRGVWERQGVCTTDRDPYHFMILMCVSVWCGWGPGGDITFPPQLNVNLAPQSHISQTENWQEWTTAPPSHHPNFPSSPFQSYPPSSSPPALQELPFLFPCIPSTTPDAGTKQPSCLPSYLPRPRARSLRKQDIPPAWFPSRRPWRECLHW